MPSTAARARALLPLAAGAVAALAWAAAACVVVPRPAVVRFPSHMPVLVPPLHYNSTVEVFQLDNGLTVALAPDERANVVGIDLRLQVGAAEDPAGKTGLAHVVEHLAFDLRAAPGGPTLAERLGEVALAHNAHTTADETHFTTLALADRLDSVLALLAEPMAVGCAGLDAATFAVSQRIVLQELAEAPEGDIEQALRARLYPRGHAYASGVGGRDVASLTLGDACGFLAARYAPAGAILVVTGHFDEAAARAAITQRFGALAARPQVKRTLVGTLAPRGGTSDLRSDVDEATAIVALPGAPWGTEDDILDRLVYRQLDERLAAADNDERWITSVDSGRFGAMRQRYRYVAISVSDPSRLDDAVDRVFTEVRRVTEAAPEMIRRHRKSMYTDLVAGYEPFTGRGEWIADYLQYTGRRELHVHDMKVLQRQHGDRYRAALRRIKREHSYVLRILPSGKPSRRARAEIKLGGSPVALPTWRAPVDVADAERPEPLPAQRRPIDVHELRLASGLRVLLVSDVTQPVLRARMIFPIGSAADPEALPGLATLTAYLLDHDAGGSYLPFDHERIMFALQRGAQVSASVGEHATSFEIVGLANGADWHLWRLHWLLESGAHDNADLARLRDEPRRPSEDRGVAWASALKAALFGADHPYARDPDPRGVLGRVRTSDLEAFRRAHYRAAGATLIVVGPFDQPRVTEVITDLFGTWDATPPAPPAAVPPRQPVRGPIWIAHEDPDAIQVRITLSFAATSRRRPARAARLVLAEVVRDRLDRVRSQLAASYGMGASYAMTDAGDTLMLDGQVEPARAAEVLRSLLADLAALRAGDRDDALRADLVRARRAVLGRVLADPADGAAVMARLTAGVGDLDAADDDALAEQIAALTPQALAAVVTADLDLTRMVVTVSGRAGEARRVLQAAGATRIRDVRDPTPTP